MKTGVVLGIDRETSTVRAVIDPWAPDPQKGRPRPATCAYLSSAVPAPLCAASFSDDLHLCNGSLALILPSLHEEFHTGAVSSGVCQGDTYWPTATTTGTASIANTATLGAGVERLSVTSTTTNDGAQLKKTDQALLLSAADGWWVSGRVKFSNAATGRVYAGFSLTSTGGSLVRIDYRYASGVTTFSVSSALGGGSSAAVVSGIEADDGEWHWLDLLLVADGFVVGWVDGELAGVIDDTAAIPNASDALQAIIYCFRGASGGSGVSYMDVDSFSIQTIKNSAIRPPAGLLY